MRVVFHERFKEVYDADPAAAPGRMECVLEELESRYPLVEAEPATEEDLLLVHSPDHLARVSRHHRIYELALLAAGGTIRAAELCLKGEPTFALVRPPGHHASPDACWGFCWFNNVAIAVEKLRRRGRVKQVLIVDFDLHYGDGTANAFARTPEVVYRHLAGRDRQTVLQDMEDCLASLKPYDLVAVSAGFDRHEADWGGVLKTEDYQTLGRLLRATGRPVFAALEGGYNHRVLGQNVRAFLEGLAG
jgi:acetoin utilization deacetylase AcuC-like enzyme